MKIPVLIFLLTLGIAGSGFSQNVRLVLKSGETKTDQIQAFSGTTLFLKNSSVKFDSLESIYFTSEEALARTLSRYLDQARVKINFSEDIGEPLSRTENGYPKEGDQVIILTCQDSATALFKRIGQHLAIKGYAIEYSSSDLLTIKTGFRPTSRLHYIYCLHAVVVKDQVVITPKWVITRGNFAYGRRSGIFDWQFSYKKGNFKKRIGRVLHAEVMKNLEDFIRLRVEYR